MIFDVDRQTLNDLAVFRTGTNQQSVFNLLCDTTTNGGQEVLLDIFNKPLTDTTELNERIAVFQYLYQTEQRLDFNKKVYDFAEFYFQKYYDTKSSTIVGRIVEGLFNSLKKSNEYYIIEQGVENVLMICDNLLKYAESLTGDLPVILARFCYVIQTSFNQNDLVWLEQLAKKGKLSPVEISKADHFFRSTAKERIRALFDIAYQMDVYQSVFNRSNQLGFSLPVIAEQEGPQLILKGLFHPFIDKPQTNHIGFDGNKNICFVTGANMAGKSSLLKSVGICIYLSQLGFPVPAAYMQTSLFNGMITSINLADDIEHGQSHFYKEVLRVKQVAQKLSQSKKLFVIFDELFRGTNVKDAYDASLAIISAFAKIKRSFFVVSTHIVEVAHELSTVDTIDFRYMETLFDDEKPVYSYQLKNGITEERLGMWIVRNEGILEIIEGALNK